MITAKARRFNRRLILEELDTREVFAGLSLGTGLFVGPILPALTVATQPVVTVTTTVGNQVTSSISTGTPTTVAASVVHETITISWDSNSPISPPAVTIRIELDSTNNPTSHVPQTPRGGQVTSPPTNNTARTSDSLSILDLAASNLLVAVVANDIDIVPTNPIPNQPGTVSDARFEVPRQQGVAFVAPAPSTDTNRAEFYRSAVTERLTPATPAKSPTPLRSDGGGNQDTVEPPPAPSVEVPAKTVTQDSGSSAAITAPTAAPIAEVSTSSNLALTAFEQAIRELQAVAPLVLRSPYTWAAAVSAAAACFAIRARSLKRKALAVRSNPTRM